LQEGQEYVCETRNNVCFILTANAEATGGLGEDEIDKKVSLLRQLATHLKETGVEDSVIDAITNLSNKGHYLGDVLRVMRQHCAPNQWCEKINGNYAQNTLAQLPAHIHEFDRLYQVLQDYNKNNPSDPIPEYAFNLITNKTQEIRTLAAGVNASSTPIYEVTDPHLVVREGWKVPPGSLAQMQVLKMNVDAHGRRDPNGNYKIIQLSHPYTAYSFGSNVDRSHIVKTDSNDICNRGGKTAGAGNCLRGFYHPDLKKIVFEPVQ
jgi:hypothetical protein